MSKDTEIFEKTERVREMEKEYVQSLQKCEIKSRTAFKGVDWASELFTKLTKKMERKIQRAEQSRRRQLGASC